MSYKLSKADIEELKCGGSGELHAALYIEELERRAETAEADVAKLVAALKQHWTRFRMLTRLLTRLLKVPLEGNDREEFCERHNITPADFDRWGIGGEL